MVNIVINPPLSGTGNDDSLNLTDLALQVGGQEIGEDLLKKGVQKGAIKLSSTMTRRISNQIVKVITENVYKVIARNVAKAGYKAGLDSLGKAASEAAEAGGTLCAATGAETAGIGCVAGAVVTAALTAFDLFNFLITFFDTEGITFVMDQAFLDNIGDTYKQAMSDAFTKAGIPGYFEDEVEFDPVAFVFNIDATTGQISYTDDYGPIYQKYVSEFLTAHPGIEDVAPSPINKIKIILIAFLIVLFFLLLGLTVSPWFLLGITLVPVGVLLFIKFFKMDQPSTNPKDYTPSEEYAISKLCTDIPSKFAPGLTEWDASTKTCRITDIGCTPSNTNPISRYMYSDNGEDLVFSSEDRVFGAFWKYWNPDMFVKKVTKNSPTKAVCSRGNSLFYKWLKFPEKRSDTPKPGVTNQVPFDYEIVNGVEKGRIPKAYCDTHGENYDDINFNCYVPKWQQLAELFSSAYLVRKARVSDKRLKTNIKFIKTIAPGADLYTYTWTDKAKQIYGNSGVDIGFIADRLDPKYIIVDEFGYKNINTDIEDATMQRISAFLILKNTIRKKMFV
jgi:hypothetical protein